jgi:hypothetical protein
VLAEEVANNAASSISETITHVEQALAEVNKSDFSAARLHLKAARAASEKITGHEATVKQANDNVIQAQIQANHGDVKKSAEGLTKALELYKAI